MQITVARPMDKFLGKKRSPGEVIDSDHEPALLDVSPQQMVALKNGGFIEDPEMKPKIDLSPINERLDAQDKRMESIEALLKELVASGKPKKG